MRLLNNIKLHVSVLKDKTGFIPVSSDYTASNDRLTNEVISNSVEESGRGLFWGTTATYASRD